MSEAMVTQHGLAIWGGEAQESRKVFLGYLSRELNKRVSHEKLWVNTVQEKGRAGKRCHHGSSRVPSWNSELGKPRENRGYTYSPGASSGPTYLAESFRPWQRLWILFNTFSIWSMELGEIAKRWLQREKPMTKPCVILTFRSEDPAQKSEEQEPGGRKPQ